MSCPIVRSILGLILILPFYQAKASSHSSLRNLAPSAIKRRSSQLEKPNVPFRDLILALSNQKNSNEAYKNKRNYNIAQKERSQHWLVKRVREDLGSGFNHNTDPAIMYSELINNNKRLDKNASAEGHKVSAKTIANLIGSLKATNADSFAKEVKDLRAKYEKERDDLDKEKNLSPDKEKELNFVKMVSWATDEALKIIDQKEKYKAPEGDEESQTFRKDFAEAFTQKMEANEQHKKNIDIAAKDDSNEAARKDVIDTFPTTLLPYSASHQDTKSIRAVGKGPQNKVDVWDLRSKKKFTITFGKSDKDIQKKLGEWRDKFATGAFALKPFDNIDPTGLAKKPEKKKPSAAKPSTGHGSPAADNTTAKKPKKQARPAQQQKKVAKKPTDPKPQVISPAQLAQRQAQQRALLRQRRAQQLAIYRNYVSRFLQARRAALSRIAFMFPGAQGLLGRRYAGSYGGGGGEFSVTKPDGSIAVDQLVNKCQECHSEIIDEETLAAKVLEDTSRIPAMPEDKPMGEEDAQKLIEWAESI